MAPSKTSKTNFAREHYRSLIDIKYKIPKYKTGCKYKDQIAGKVSRPYPKHETGVGTQNKGKREKGVRNLVHMSKTYRKLKALF